MPLSLPDGTACFIDANIFYYHFVETPVVHEPCSLFLDRIAQGRLLGYTSTHVLAEAIHKIMMAELSIRFNLTRAGLVQWLQRHPSRIAELTEFRAAASEIDAMGIPILATDDTALLRSATECSARYHLLTNDAIIIALMQRHGLTHLVTNDDDFDGIPGLTVWKPR